MANFDMFEENFNDLQSESTVEDDEIGEEELVSDEDGDDAVFHEVMDDEDSW